MVPARLRSHNYAFLSLDGKSVLELEAEDVKMINDLLEDMMSTALVYFVLGHVSGNEKQDLVQKSIEDFMTRYHLFDFEFNVQQLRQMYYRSKTREALLFRFQRRPGQQKVRSLIHVTAASGIQP